MKFSLFYEMQISNPTRETEQQMFRRKINETFLAERL